MFRLLSFRNFGLSLIIRGLYGINLGPVIGILAGIVGMGIWAHPAARTVGSRPRYGFASRTCGRYGGVRIRSTCPPPLPYDLTRTTWRPSLRSASASCGQLAASWEVPGHL